jgi:hypothetical protein
MVSDVSRYVAGYGVGTLKFLTTEFFCLLLRSFNMNAAHKELVEYIPFLARPARKQVSNR